MTSYQRTPRAWPAESESPMGRYHDQITNPETAQAFARFFVSLSPALNVRASDVNGNRVAKQIRDDLKAAITAGVLPKGCKISVRQNAGAYYSSSVGSMQVTISAWRGAGAVLSDRFIEAILDGDKDRTLGDIKPRYSEAFSDALAIIERIADRHNFDNSRIEEDYFHVGYYLTVSPYKVEAAEREGLEQERDARKSRATWKCYTCMVEGTGQAPTHCPECGSEYDADHGPHTTAPAEGVARVRMSEIEPAPETASETTTDATPDSVGALGFRTPEASIHCFECEVEHCGIRRAYPAQHHSACERYVPNTPKPIGAESPSHVRYFPNGGRMEFRRSTTAPNMWASRYVARTGRMDTWINYGADLPSEAVEIGVYP